jgi:uncharacterized membrane protein
MEVVCKLIEKHKFVNRGFLVGPICPIYGYGCLLITLLLNKYKDNVVLLFIMAIVICSILEYMTSYIMEKIFKTRWWDYSKKKFNINGRICMDTMIPFGILGCIVVYVLNPAFINLLSHVDYRVLYVLSVVFLISYIVDNVMSFSIIYNFRKTILNIEKDATEEITQKVKEAFKRKGLLERRLIHAFPNMKDHKERLIELRDRINRELENIDVKRVKAKLKVSKNIDQKSE